MGVKIRMLTVFKVQLGWKLVDPFGSIAERVLLRVVENPSFESLRDLVQEDASDYFCLLNYEMIIYRHNLDLT